MSDYRTFCDHYGNDYDTEAERRAGYELHERNRVELSAIFFPPLVDPNGEAGS